MKIGIRDNENKYRRTMITSSLKLIRRLFSCLLIGLMLSGPIQAAYTPISVETANGSVSITKLKKLKFIGGAMADQENGTVLLTFNGDISSSNTITDHAIIRGDGGAKGIQTSAVLIDDSDNISGVTSLTVDGTSTSAVVVDTTVFVVDASNDRVGVGTASPSSTLDVVGDLQVTTNGNFGQYIYHDGDTDTSIRFQDDDLEINVGGEVAINVVEDGSQDIVEIGDDGDIDIKLSANGDGALFAEGSSGNIGLGTSSPVAQLHIDSDGIDETNNAELLMTSQSNTNWMLGIDNGNTSAFTIANGTDLNTDTALTIEKAGNVGIATTSPGSKLDVAGTITMTGFKLSTGPTADFVLASDGAGVGTWTNLDTLTNAGHWEDVNNTLHPKDNGADENIVIGGTTLANSDISLQYNGATVFNEAGNSVDFRIESDTNGHMFFVDGSTSRIGIDTSAPDKTLEINSVDGNNLRLTYDDDDGSAANYVDFTLSSTADLTIAAIGGDISFSDENLLTTGTLGAGNTTVTGTLTVTGASTLGGDIDFNSGNIDLSTQTVDVQLNAAADALNFDSDTLSIDASNDRIGIGTNAPSSTLDVVGDLQVTTNGYFGQYIYHDGDTDTSFRFQDDDLEINVGGEVAINVVEDGSQDIVEIGDDGDIDIKLSANGDGALFAEGSSGNIGLGTSSPAAQLHIDSDGIDETNNAELLMTSQSNVNWILGIDNGNTSAFTIANGTDLNTDTHLTITKAGNTGIGTSSPNELVTIEGVTSLRETTAPSNTGNYGKIYVKTSDSELYFMDDAGTETVLSGDDAGQWTDTGTLLHPSESSGAEDVVIGGTTLAGSDISLQANGSSVFNEAGNSVDFRVESDTNGHMFFVDGSTSRIGIDTSAPDKTLEINSVDGNNLRLTYDDDDGSAANYVDFTLSSSADLTVAAIGGDISFSDENLLTTGTLGAGNTTVTGTLTVTGASTLGGDIDFNSGNIDLSTQTVDVQLNAAADALNFDSDTLSIDASNDRVGIGTNAPSATLDVVGDLQVTTNGYLGQYLYHDGDTDTSVRFQADDVEINAGGKLMIDIANTVQDLVEIGDDSDVDIKLSAGSDGAVFVEGSTSNVGIGTLTPSAKLDVVGDLQVTTNGHFGQYVYHDGDTDTSVRFQDDDVEVNVGGEVLISLIEAGQDIVELGDDGDVDIKLSANGDGALFAEGSSGNIGLGTSSPVAQLHIDSDGIDETNNAELLMTSQSNTNWMLGIDNGNTSAFTIANGTDLNTDTALSIQKDGNVGIATTSPASKLDVAGTITMTGFKLSTSPTANFVLASDGAGVGTWTNLDTLTNAGHWEDVNNTLHPKDNGADENIVIGGTTLANSDISLQYNGATVFNEAGNSVDFRIESDTNGHMFFVDGSTSRIGIDTSAPDKTLEINSVDGNNLRLTYDDDDGSAANYVDFTLDSSADLTIAATGGDISFSDEDLLTTGTLGAGNTTVTGTLTVTGASTLGGDIDFNSTNIDLSTQTVDVQLNAAADALNFDSNTLSIDASNDRVGIGTNSPSATLDVVGDLQVTTNGNFGQYLYHDGDTDTSVRFQADDVEINAGGKLMIDIANTVQDLVEIGDDSDVDIKLSAGTDGAVFVEGSTSNVGIGTLTPSAKLDVVGDLQVTTNGHFGQYVYHDGDTDTSVRFQADDVEINAGGKLMIDIANTVQDLVEIGDDSDVDIKLSAGSDGAVFVEGSTSNVGIGTLTPSAKLDVVGDLQVTTNGHFGQYIYHDGDTDTSLRFQDDDLEVNVGGEVAINVVEDGSQDIVEIGDDGDIDIKLSANGDGALFAEGSSGNIGLGTSSPVAQLHIDSDGIDETNNAELLMTSQSNTNWMLGIDNGNTSAFTIANGTDLNTDTALTIEKAGNVGIATTSPGSKLDVAGTITMTGFKLSTSPTANFVLASDGAGVGTWTNLDTLTNAGHWEDVNNTLHPKDNGADENIVIGGTTLANSDISLQYNGATVFNEAGNSVDFRIESDTNGHMFFIDGSTSRIGIDTSAPDKTLEINSVDGNNLRLTYDDDDGSAANYVDFTLDSSADLTIAATGGDISFSDEDLLTTGTLGAGNTTVTGTLTVTGASTLGGDIDFNSTNIDLSTQTVDVQLNAAADALNFDSNTLSIDASNDRVGIGTNSPSATLDVVGDLQVTTNGNFGQYLYHDGDTDTSVRFQADDVEINAGGKLMIDIANTVQDLVEIGDDSDVDIKLSAGTDGAVFVEGSTSNVGIGTLTPSAKLDVVGDLQVTTNGHFGQYIYHDGDTDTSLRFQDDDLEVNVGGEVAINVVEDGSQDIVEIGDDGDIDIKLSANGDGALFAEGSSGNIGLGTSSPVAQLHIDSDGIDETNNAELLMTSQSNTNWMLGIDNGNTSAFTIANGTDLNTDTALSIQKDGNVGIATTSPGSKLDVAGTITMTGFKLSTSPTANFVLASDGAGVGTWTNLDTLTNAGHWEDVNNTLHPKDNGADENIVIGGTTLANSDISLQYNGATVFNEAGNSVDFRIESDTNGHMFFVDGSTSRIGIDTSAPDKTLEINSVDGNNLRLTYDDDDGSAANYVDFTLSSSADLTVAAIGGDISFSDENLLTTGTLGAGNTTVTGTLTATGATTIGGDIDFNSTNIDLSTQIVAVQLNAAANALNFDSDTLTVDASNDRVGVGTNAPSSTLDVVGDLQVTTNGNFGQYIYHDGDTDTSLRFQDDDLEINVGGEVAINVVEDGSQDIVEIGDDGDIDIKLSANGDGALFAEGSSGNIGLGTSSPAAQLHIDSDGIDETNNAELLMTSQSNVNWILGIDNGNTSAFTIANGTDLNTDTALTIEKAGNIGIGTSSPNEKLTIEGSLSLDEVSAPGATAGYGKLYVDSGNNKLYFIEGGGTSYNLTNGTTGSATDLDGLTDAATDSTSVFLGDSSGTSDSGSTYNTAVGINALDDTSGGSLRNVAIGYDAMKDITTGDDNVAIGYQAFENNTTGIDNIAIGSAAMFTSTGGANYNVAIGHNSMYQLTAGDNNVAVGMNSLNAITTGYQNVAVGHRALFSTNTGWSNTGLGYYALDGNTTGKFNTAVGWQALDASSTVNYGTAVGYQALVLSTGANNTALGAKAGDNITTGTDNVIIGYDNDANSATANKQLDIMDIFYGNGNTGYAGIGVASPQAQFHIDSDGTSSTNNAEILMTSQSNTDWIFGIDNGNSSAFTIANGNDLNTDTALTILKDGNVGIGTTSPSSTLNVSGTLNVTGATTIGGDIDFNSTNIDLSTQIVAVQLNAAANALNFDSDTLTVDASNDRVGVGTNAPSSTLDVVGDLQVTTNGNFGQYIYHDGDTDTSVRFQDDDLEINVGGEVAINVVEDGSQDIVEIGDDGDIDIKLSANGDGALFAEGSSGNIGLGTSSPAAQLHIDSDGIDETNNAEVLMTSQSNTNWVFGIDNGNTSAFTIANGTDLNTDTALTIQKDGNVGIGTTSPGSTLDISGTATMTGFKLSTGATNNYLLTSDASGVGTWQAAPASSEWTDNSGFVYPNTSATDNVGVGGTTAGGADTILYADGAATFNETGASVDFRVESNTKDHLLFVDGDQDKVGINESAPDATLELATASSSTVGLHVKGSSSQSSSLVTYTDNSNNNFFDSGDGLTGSTVVWNEQGVSIDFRVESNTEENMFFVDASTDRIGLGLNTPQYRLHLHEPSSSGVWMQFSNTTTGSGNDKGMFFGLSDSEVPQIWAQSGKDIEIYPGYALSTTFDSGGNVGIGTQSPGAALDVETDATADGIHINNTKADGDAILAFQFSGTSEFTMGVDDGDSDKFKIGTTAIGTNTRLTIDDAGNVGIGTSTPGSTLEVSGTATMTGFKLTTGATDTYVLTSDATGVGTWQAAGAAGEWTDNSGFIHPNTAATDNAGVGGTTAAGADTILYATGAATFNETGASVDFRVEGDTIENMLFVDGSADKVGIGTDTPAAMLEVNGAIMFTTEYDNGNSGSSKTVDFVNGNKQKITLSDNCTLTINAPGVGNYLLRIVQDGTGSRTITWPAAVKWPSNVAPTLTTTASGIDIVTCYHDGSDYYCQASLDFQ